MVINYKIKHMSLARVKTAAEQEWYLCNQAVTPTEEKLVYRWDKVTCKNCLKQRPWPSKIKLTI